ncbi:MAG TPA: hypothetical protein VMW16_06305 [Sedimentisphaerales bacterium]|nr:hypothetical protein [Sedimentisphaerales bacterium]
MKTNRCSRPSDCKCFFLPILVCMTCSIGLSGAEAGRPEMDNEIVDCSAFRETLQASDDIKAMSIGDSIFARLVQKYRNDAGFRAYEAKLNAAEFLANQMQSQLKQATDKQLVSATQDLFNKQGTGSRQRSPTVAPAKSFYETSVKLFSNPITTGRLVSEEKAFLSQYYDLKLRLLTSVIAKAGQALAITEPSFRGTHDCVLVLPLLHVSDKQPVNIDVLPRWMRQPEQLDMFSDSCLLHFGLPFHAMMLAKKSAEIREKSFSELDFYKSAAQKCGKSSPHIGADCLVRAIDYVPDKDPNATVALQFDVVQLWLDSDNFIFAAGQAHKIFEAYPNHPAAGKAIWLYHYALSKSNNIDEILAHIDEALGDKRCEAYKSKLMYIKWWALHRKRDETARVAAIEYELLKLYADDPRVAPILLSRATDSLARQDYKGAKELLTQLVEKFPSSKAAEQAEQMLAKLKTTKGAQ